MSVTMAEGREQDRIDQEASEWLVLREERALDRAEQQAFDAWRAADPRHEQTYSAMERTWGDIPQLSALKDLVPIEPEATPAPPAWRMRPRWAIGALAVAAAAALALLWLPGLLGPAAPTRYETRVAEIRELTLPDGTRVTLGPRTALTERFTDGERRIVLANGEAFFDVAHNAARPFVIEAGGSLVRVTGTKFNVNSSPGALRVSVLEGSVQVTGPRQAGRPGPAPRMLTAGQRLVIVAAAAGETQAPAAAELSQVQRPGAWRDGRLVYENARLDELVADVNRYYAPGVTLADPAVANLRVTASFRASEIPAFMSALGDVVPVRAEESATGGFRLERAGN